MKVDLSDTRKIIQQYRKKKGILIPLLQEIQADYGYVPKESVDLISKELAIYPVEIYGILTFYAQFYLTPRGRHTIKVCQGTACHVMGGKEILDYLSNKLEISEGETTKDNMFSLERVACLGCCGMAPVVVVDNNFYGRCTIQKLDKLLEKYQEIK
ncbi:NADH-quinone oxidoreductase subunit NuoE [Candidatus Aerophobetes bacterium]|nr:NADH-quinone oxidoreductase subunit NuoE [Candidatus Aerophobetes bacterium]